MSVSAEFLDYLLEQLTPLGGVRARRMFGGAGLYREGRMFALIADDRLFVKVDEVSCERFVQAQCTPFSYAKKGGKTVVMSYYAIPDEALGDQDELLMWANLGVSAVARVG